jgi:hypothetical protein
MTRRECKRHFRTENPETHSAALGRNPAKARITLEPLRVSFSPDPATERETANTANADPSDTASSLALAVPARHLRFLRSLRFPLALL